MSTERDDPKGLHRSAQSESAETAGRPAENEKRLFEWAARVAGGALRQGGFSEQDVETILKDAVHDYATFKKAAKNRRQFLLARVWARAKQYAKLRGLAASSDTEARTPHLLEVIHTHEAVALLPKNAQTAIRMLFFEHKTHEEVAEALGVSVAYVRRLFRKSMARLKKWRPPREPQE
jgi:RNA polymerase sigma factor (sigma-70 family)